MDSMSANQTAEYLHVAPETLRFWRWKGVGPASYKIGRAVRYDRTDVDQWVGQQKAATRAGGAA